MKFFVVTLFIFSSLFANEMQRIENIVNDISKLRVDYEECKSQLALKKNSVPSFKANGCDCDDIRKEYTFIIKDEKQKNSILHKELDEVKLSSANDEKLIQKIDELEKRIQSQNNVLKTKDRIIDDLGIQTIELKNKIAKLKEKYKNSLKNTQTKVVEVDKNVVCEKPKDTNSFPKLMMKEEAQEIVVTVEEKAKEVIAGSYQLRMDADIYDAINGNKVDFWTIDTSFTSNVQSENWIKITGYFVGRKWKPSSKSLWLKKQAVQIKEK